MEVYLEVPGRMDILEKEGGNPRRLDSAHQSQSQVSSTVMVSWALPSSGASIGLLLKKSFGKLTLG